MRGAARRVCKALACRQGGKTYRIVLAGPFAPEQLGAALNKARRAGFSDAFVR